MVGNIIAIGHRCRFSQLCKRSITWLLIWVILMGDEKDLLLDFGRTCGAPPYTAACPFCLHGCHFRKVKIIRVCLSHLGIQKKKKTRRRLTLEQFVTVLIGLAGFRTAQLNCLDCSTEWASSHEQQRYTCIQLHQQISLKRATIYYKSQNVPLFFACFTTKQTNVQIKGSWQTNDHNQAKRTCVRLAACQKSSGNPVKGDGKQAGGWNPFITSSRMQYNALQELTKDTSANGALLNRNVKRLSGALAALPLALSALMNGQ